MKSDRAFFSFVVAFVGTVGPIAAQAPVAAQAPAAAQAPVAAQAPQVEILTNDKGVSYDAGTETLTDHVTKCSIKFPVEPTSKLTRASTPHGVILIRTHTANLGDMILTMTQTKHPKKMLEAMGVDLEKDAAKFIELSSQYGARSRKESKVRSRRESELNGVKGVEVAISYPGAPDGAYETGLTIERTYVHNGLMYVVMVEVTRDVLEKDRTTPKRILALMDSFSFLAAKKARASGEGPPKQ